MTPLNKTLLFVAISFLVASCIKEEIEVSDLSYGIEPEFGVPIAFARIEAERIIQNFDENGIVESGTNGSLSLVYIDTLEGLTTTDLLDLPNQQFEKEIDLSTLDQAEAIDFGALTIVEDELYSFESHEGDRLDSIRFESGSFHLSLNSSGTYPISGIVRIYSADNTVAFSTSFQDQVPPIAIDTESEMTDVLFLLQNNSGITNGVRFEYELTFTDVPGGSAGEVDFTIEMNDFSIRHTGGYIAPRQIEFDGQNLGIHLFDQSTIGELRIEDPRLHLHFSNGFGLGLGLQISELRGITADDDVMIIDGENISDFPTIESAAFLGDVAETDATLSNEMIIPSLTDFMAFAPKVVEADLVLSVNPDEETSVFVSNANELGLSFEAEIPIFGSIADFLLVDTTEVSIGDFIETANEAAEVESIDMRLFVDNGFPIDAGVQIVFVGPDMQPIDSLFQEPNMIFNSAPVNLGVDEHDPTYGMATGKTSTLTIVSLSQDRIPALEEATHMIIRVSGNTSGNGDYPIRLTDTDNFDVHLSAKTKLNL